MIRCKTFAFASILSSILTVSAYAQSQQTVAFIGDNFIADLCIQPEFINHSNWSCYAKDQETPMPGPGGAAHGSGAALTALISIIKSGQKPVIFFEAGEEDMAAISPSDPYSLIMASWAANVIQIINTAQAAKLPIIVATIPYTYWGDRNPFNRWLMEYAAKRNVPVVNFDWSLNNPPTISVEGGPQSQDITYFCGCGEHYGANPQNYIPTYVLTVTGWDLVTNMAETQIGLTTGAFNLIGGYLGTIANESSLFVLPANYNGATAGANTVSDGSALQFSAYGQYSDGKTRTIENADINGHIGMWNSSSPGVIFIDQTGLASAMEPGSSNIHFTTLSGMTLNEWVMHVDKPSNISF